MYPIWSEKWDAAIERTIRLPFNIGANILRVLQSTAGYLVSWPLQETSGAVSLADNVKDDLGRNVILEGDFPNDPGVWTLGANWTIAGNKCTYDDTGTSPCLQVVNLKVGAVYQISFTIADLSAGGADIAFASSSGSVLIRDWETFGNGGHIVLSDPIPAGYNGDLEFFSRTDSGSAFSITNLTFKQTDILASSAYDPASDNPLTGDDTGTTPGVAGQGGIRYMKTYDGATSFTDIYSAELNSMFNPDAGTLIAAARSDTWAAGIDLIARLGVDADNEVYLSRSGTDLILSYDAGGTAESVTIPSGSPTGVFSVALSWDTTGGGEVKAYYNGVQSGSTQTIAGAWVGNLAATLCCIGANSTTPTNVWEGDIAYPALYSSALTQPEILRIHNSMRI